ncbi:MAG: HAMP domain-containing histidine kinase [Actinomycetota bacterium]|nr:HAMP domain-containing histidine kinase [Actinomycetota bacterium]
MRRRRPITLRTRLVVAAAMAVGLSVATASAGSFLVVRHQLMSQVNKGLLHQARQVHRRIGPEIPSLAPVSSTLQRVGLNALIPFQIIRADGTVITRDLTPALPINGTDRAVAAGKRTENYRTLGTVGRENHSRLLTYSLGNGVAVQLARPLGEIDRTLARLALALSLVAAAGVVLSVILGYLVARAGLKPVERLSEAVERVGATRRLNERIEVNGDDELTRLAISFNTMISALDESRRQQAQLVADAGHELRSPLTSLRTNIEVLVKARDLAPADREALVADVTAQLDELTNLVGDLVELARDDEHQPEVGDIRLDLVVDHAVERARRRAPTLHFAVAHRPALVRGSAGLLERAVLNVIDNAAKWSPPGSTVEIDMFRDGDAWRLEVRDHGPGIDAEDLPRVFDRFYRAPGARSQPGSGLGLAIVRQVVESTGGTVHAEAAVGGGTLVRFCLPAVDAAEHPSDRDDPDTGGSGPPGPDGSDSPDGQTVEPGGQVLSGFSGRTQTAPRSVD